MVLYLYEYRILSPMNTVTENEQDWIVKSEKSVSTCFSCFDVAFMPL